MKKVLILALFVTVFSISCAGTPKVVKQFDGTPIKIFVFTDHGDPKEIPEVLYSNRVVIKEWMENDLIKILAKAGYEGVRLYKLDEYIPGKGKYLFKITIVSQHNVPPSARYWGGSFAGADTMNNLYELRGEGETILLSYEDGAGSTRSIRHIAQKLNRNAVKKIEEALE